MSIFTPLLSINAFFWTKEVFFVKILQSIYSQLLVFDENVSKQRVIWYEDPLFGFTVDRACDVVDLLSLLDLSDTNVFFFFP